MKNRKITQLTVFLYQIIIIFICLQYLYGMSYYIEQLIMHNIIIHLSKFMFKKGKSGPYCWGWEVPTNLHKSLATACRLYRLETDTPQSTCQYPSPNIRTNKCTNIHSYFKERREFNGTSTHLLDGYISANQRFFLHS